MTNQPDHENTADKAAVTPPPALTTEGRLRARVQTLEEDAERNQGLAKVGARCMREGHQGLIESGRATVEGHRFALSVKLGLGTDATWDAIHERVKELRVDSAEAAAVSAAVAPPTDPTHGLSVQHADALSDAVAIPGPRTPTYPEQHERVCRVVRDILDELTPARDDADAQTALRDRIADKLTAAAYECDGKCGLSERECYDAHPITFSAMAGGTTHVDGSVTAIADAVLAALPPTTDRAAVLSPAERAMLTYALDQAQEHIWSRDGFTDEDQAAVDSLRRMADETATETPAAVDLPTLAAALDGLHTLIATSSRDWQTYRVDAWLWAVLCGWDCEQTEHDETCTHGALEETAAMHGWDEATVAKARRYRAAVRAATEALPAAGARQDGTPDVQTQPATPMTAHLTTLCDACNHTLNWHSSGETGCTVLRCACARYYHAAGQGQDGTET